jgi:hypothetical protein
MPSDRQMFVLPTPPLPLVTATLLHAPTGAPFGALPGVPGARGPGRTFTEANFSRSFCA